MSPALTPEAPHKRPRGRPRVFDEVRRHTLCELIAVGLSRQAAAAQVGVPPSSVVYAAQTDPAFAARLIAAEHLRANRPPDRAHVGRRGWRAAAKALETLNPDRFRLPKSKFERQLADPRFERAVLRIVHKVLRKSLPLPLGEGRGEGAPSATAGCSELAVASLSSSALPRALGEGRGAGVANRPPDYCSTNPLLVSAQCETKTIIDDLEPIIVSQTPMH